MGILQSTLKLTLLDDVTKNVRRIGSTLQAFEKRSLAPFTGAIGKVVAFGGAYLTATAGFENTFSAASKAQDALTEIGIKADLSRFQLAELQKRLTSLSPSVNQTTGALTEGVDVMLGMGLAANDAQAAIPAIGKAATATAASITDLSSSSVSAMQNMHVLPTEIAKMLDGMASAGNAGAFELRDMAQYFPQLTASAQSLGMEGVSSVNDLAAALQIARRGTGDASTAANNLADFMAKIVNPQTTKNLKKFGVDVRKELALAHKKGISPIEHFVELIGKKTDGGRNDLLTQIFGDKQVLDFMRPMIAGLADYKKIREDANKATGTIDAAYAQRMDNASEKLKALSIRFQNIGTSIGMNLLGPVGQVADGIGDIFDTLDERSTVFDQMRWAVQGFLQGFGMDGGIRETIRSIGDMLFGPAEGTTAKQDRMAAIFAQFREWGADLKQLKADLQDNPIVKFFESLSPYSWQIIKWTIGLGLLSAAIRKVAAAMYFLSGASAIVGALKTVGSLAGIVKGGGKRAGKPGAPGLPDGGPPMPASWAMWIAAAVGGARAAKASYTGDTLYSQGKTLLPDFTDALHALGVLVGKFNASSGGVAPTSTTSFLAMEQARQASAAGYGNSTDTLPGKLADDFVRIDASSIAAMTQPSGVQQVQVTNPPPPPIVPMNNVFNISGVSDPKAAASAAISELGSIIKNAKQALFSD